MDREAEDHVLRTLGLSVMGIVSRREWPTAGNSVACAFGEITALVRMAQKRIDEINRDASVEPKQSETMNITVRDRGDRSVGIEPAEIVIEWPFDIDDEEERKNLRDSVTAFAKPWMDGKFTVSFSDQCDLCGSVGGSHTRGCPELEQET